MADGEVSAGPTVVRDGPKPGEVTRGPWHVRGGNDIDDYPVVVVESAEPVRMFLVYSVADGRSVAYVPRLEDALAIARSFQRDFAFTPLPIA